MAGKEGLNTIVNKENVGTAMEWGGVIGGLIYLLRLNVVGAAVGGLVYVGGKWVKNSGK
jgi:hypothetical protein